MPNNQEEPSRLNKKYFTLAGVVDGVLLVAISASSGIWAAVGGAAKLLSSALLTGYQFLKNTETLNSNVAQNEQIENKILELIEVLITNILLSSKSENSLDSAITTLDKALVLPNAVANKQSLENKSLQLSALDAKENPKTNDLDAIKDYSKKYKEKLKKIKNDNKINANDILNKLKNINIIDKDDLDSIASILNNCEGNEQEHKSAKQC